MALRTLRLLLIAPLLVAMLASCGSNNDDASSDEKTPSGQDSTATGGTEPQTGTCAYPKSKTKPAKAAKAPPAEPVAQATMTITTSRGAIKLALDAKAAPCTVNSFVSLAKQGYFNDTQCHRLVKGFVLQCGDPTATGKGGPGYTFTDELTGKETYTAGTLAMANSGPDTNGSQFFIVLADSNLSPAYTVFGKVDAAGLNVAKAIENDGTLAGKETPAKKVVIESVK